MTRAIHPVGCACTNCLIGRSVPIDQAPIEVFDAYARSQYAHGESEMVVDSSGTTEREFDEWVERAERRS